MKQRLFSARWWAAGLALVAACQNAPTPHPTSTEPGSLPGAGQAPATAPREVPGAGAGAAQAAGAQAAAAQVALKDEPAAAFKEDVTPVRVRAEGQLGPGINTLFIDIAPPEGAKLTLDSPLSVRGSGGIGLSFPRRLSGPLSSHPMPLRLPIDVSDGATGPASVEVTYYWCTDGNEAACRREQARIDVELDLTGSSAGGEAHLTYRARDKS